MTFENQNQLLFFNFYSQFFQLFLFWELHLFWIIKLFLLLLKKVCVNTILSLFLFLFLSQHFLIIWFIVFRSELLSDVLIVIMTSLSLYFDISRWEKQEMRFKMKIILTILMYFIVTFSLQLLITTIEEVSRSTSYFALIFHV